MAAHHSTVCDCREHFKFSAILIDLAGGLRDINDIPAWSRVAVSSSISLVCDA